MEQKGKKYNELNKYERVMTNASLEQRMEAMAHDVEQIATVLGMSVHIDATFFSEENHCVEVSIFPGLRDIVSRQIEQTGDLFGIIEEAMNEKTTPAE